MNSRSSSILTTSPSRALSGPKSIPKSLRRSLETGASRAVDEVGDAAELDVESYRTRDVANREVSVEHPLAGATAHPGRAERHRRPSPHVEQVGTEYVGVAIGVAGVDRRDADGGLDRSFLRRRADG